MGRDNDDSTFTRAERDGEGGPICFESEEQAEVYLQNMKIGDLFPSKGDELQLQRVWMAEIEDE